MLCMTRVSYGNTRAYAQSFAVPSYKVARVCITSVCDHLRVIRKLLPQVAAHAEFQLCVLIWWFGFLRCLQITNQADFFAFREDFVGMLIPQYKAAFARYTTIQVQSLFY